MNVLGIFILTAYFCYLVYLMHKEKRDVSYFLVYVAIVVASLPALKNIVMLGVDTSVHMGRIAGLTQTIVDGYFPPRMLTWVRNSYGWAAGIMYPQLLLYVPAIWGAIFGLQESKLGIYAMTNSLIILTNIFTAWFMYKAAKEMYKEKMAGIIAAIFITLFGFRVRQLYVIGSVGEFLGLMCVPIYVLGLYYIFNDKEDKWYVATIGMTMLLGSHLITTFLIGILSFLGAVIFFKKIIDKKHIIALVKAYGFALLINLTMLVPLLDYMRIEGLNITMQVDYVGRLGLMYICTVGNYDNLGLLFTVILITTVVLICYYMFKLKYIKIDILKKILNKKQEQEENIKKEVHNRNYTKSELEEIKNTSICFKSSVIVFIFMFLALLFCTSKHIIPNLEKIEAFRKIYSNIQFPRRWFSVIGPLLALSSSYLIFKTLKSLVKRVLLIVFVAAMILSIDTVKYYIIDYSNQQYSSNIAPNMDWGDYSYPNISTDYANVINNSFNTSSDSIQLENTDKKGLKVTFDYKNSSGTEGKVICPLLYYPGYLAKDDKNNILKTEIDDNNLLNVIVEGTEGTVTVDFVGFPHWKYFDILSLLSFIAFILLVLKENKLWFFKNKEIVKVKSK